MTEDDDVAAFLGERHGAPVLGVERLGGGHWSSAFGYRTADGRELVVRFGPFRDAFEGERRAMAYANDDLPVPAVLEVGDAFDRCYAISVRHHGRFLEDIRPEEASTAGPTVERLLRGLRAVPAPRTGTTSWRTWLLDALVDDEARTTHGWRATLAADPDLDGLFRSCEAHLGAHIDDVPERRDLVHADLLHGNVLVDDTASNVTAVFSWKCSTWGDWVYDLAWCTFWSAWHPGIAALDLWARLGSDEAARRHHLYEVQIGASHLGWYAWTGDEANLRRCAARTREVLDR